MTIALAIVAAVALVAGTAWQVWRYMTVRRYGQRLGRYGPLELYWDGDDALPDLTLWEAETGRCVRRLDELGAQRGLWPAGTVTRLSDGLVCVLRRDTWRLSDGTRVSGTAHQGRIELRYMPAPWDTALAHELVHLALWDLDGDPDRTHAAPPGPWTSEHDEVIRDLAWSSLNS